MSIPYAKLAAYYDALNAEVNYTAWAKDLDTRMRELGIPEGSLVLDLGCGTGNMTLPLAKLGWDMIGIDRSIEMLSEAREKSAAEGLDILWLCQDMSEIELYGTVKATVCCLDCINYLTDAAALAECFRLVRLFTEPGGLFLFDVNTPYKFKNVYADRTYILEDESVFLSWENYFNEKTNICEFILTFFAKEEDGRYSRTEEVQRERCYSRPALERLLKKAGFEIVEVASNPMGAGLEEDTERWHFICRAI
ncbi:MAG: class I SAM-dependent methyltransferase [Clostridia bacterium]|nr:class I SAM-dependent methyltransferase [Clostridia bacterium]